MTRLLRGTMMPALKDLITPVMRAHREGWLNSAVGRHLSEMVEPMLRQRLAETADTGALSDALEKIDKQISDNPDHWSNGIIWFRTAILERYKELAK